MLNNTKYNIGENDDGDNGVLCALMFYQYATSNDRTKMYLTSRR